MVDDAGRERVQVEVGHAVGADDHRALLAAERIDHRLQGAGRTVEVITVELHGKPAACRVQDARVPASADAEVVAFGADVDDALVRVCQPVDDFRSAVSRMVVDDDDIIGKRGLLCESRTDCVADGSYPVSYGDDDRSFCVERDSVEVDVCEVIRVEVSADSFEMFRTDAFHFDLHIPVSRVDIVELAFTREAGVCLFFRVEVFVQVYDTSGSLSCEP